jgi:NAD(P)H-dependent FMN reductase
MAYKPKILAFAGSMREDSVNKKLIKIAVAGARKAGAETTLIDLSDFRMPLYDGDLEAKEGVPKIAQQLKKMMIEHDGLLIASPEYNSSIPGVLKNVIDWVSRPEEGEKVDLPAFRGKVVAIMSASPSGWGGLRGLVTLRSMLENIHCMVLPSQVTVSHAYDAFTPNGQLKDVSLEERVLKQGKSLVDILMKLKG